MLPIELGMNLVLGHLRCGVGVTVHIAADPALIIHMRNGIGVLVGQHLVDRLTRFDVAVQAIGDSFVKKVGRLAVKGFTI